MDLKRQCQECHSFLKHLHSCPNGSLNPLSGSPVQATIQLLYLLGSFVPYFIVVLILAYSLIKKDRYKLILFIIIVVQNLLCSFFKSIIRQNRPLGSCSFDFSYGFPSNHSSFAGALWLYVLYENCFLRKRKFLSFWVLFISAYTILVMVSRFNLNYHTIQQISFGFCIGSGIALFVVLNTKKLFPNLIQREEAKELHTLHTNLEKVHRMHEEVEKTQARVRAAIKKMEKEQKKE